MLILGDQHLFIEESLEVEFKEFCLNEINISHNDLYNIVTYGKINNKNIFNEHILNTINYYFYKYVPKYISAFINSNINGNLIFGVNDYGEITGIPFFGNKKDLENFVYNIDFSKYLKNFNKKNHIININVKKISIDNNYLSNISDKLLQEYYKNIKEKNDLINKYKKDRIKWINNLNEYTCKLRTLIESKKDDFDKYLKIHAPHMLNYIIKENEMKNISHLKTDPTHYIYWLMLFKEENLLKIKKNKPEVPNISKIYNSPQYLFTHLTNLRYKLLNSNRDINYFIIHISIKINFKNNNIIYYKHNNKYIAKYRKLYNNIPIMLDKSRNI